MEVKCTPWWLVQGITSVGKWTSDSASNQPGAVTAVSNTTCIVAALSVATMPGYLVEATLAFTDFSNMRSLYGEMDMKGRMGSQNHSYSTFPFEDSPNMRRRLLSQCSIGASSAKIASCTLTASVLDASQVFHLLAWIQGPPISTKNGSLAAAWEIPYSVTFMPPASGERHQTALNREHSALKEQHSLQNMCMSAMLIACQCQEQHSVVSIAQDLTGLCCRRLPF